MEKKKVQGSSPRKDMQQVHAEWDALVRKHVYGHAPEEHYFRMANGEKVHDLKELVHALARMQDDIFRHHVNTAKNDFSTWVKDVFKRDDLATELHKWQSRMEAELAVQRYLNRRLERLSKKLFYPGQVR